MTATKQVRADEAPGPAACSLAERETALGGTLAPRTKIIATIGPASSGPEAVQALVEAGVSVFRLNFSHGTPDEHAARLADVRAAADALGQAVAVMGDLPGPKIRVGEVRDGGVEVVTGANVVFQRQPIVAEASAGDARFSSRYEHLVDDVEPGQRLLVNDGAVRLLIVDKRADEIRCTVTHGGLITSGKGINLPDTQLSVPALRDRDWAYVRWAIDHGLDWLAMSFVACARDLQTLVDGIEREAAQRGRPGLRLPVVAKIERPRAVENMDEIAAAADAIMVARGDLGVEMDLALVPVIQRRLIRVAHEYGKPCIVATQMLESMIERPQPTRAEASDVATAIFDDIDAVMLSGETAVGRYPRVAVETMRRIAGHTERYVASMPRSSTPPSRLVAARDPQAALAHGVWTVAEDSDAVAIVIWSQSGTSARYVSQNSLRLPVVAVSSDERVVRQMAMLRGVRPVHMDIPDNLSAFTTTVDDHVQSAGLARAGERIILVAGWPIAAEMVTNTLAIHQVGDPSSGYRWHK